MAVNKKEIAREMAEKTGNTIKAMESVIDVFWEVVKKKVKTDKVQLAGISFETVETKAREGRNPKTGESISIPSKTKIKVKLTKGFGA